jgi:RNA polymerase sigma-32 factor
MWDSTGIHQHLVRVAMRAPFLDRDEEYRLANLWRHRHDEIALHRLAAAHMRLAVALAGRFRRYGLPMADLIQEGHVGLLEAAARFEPERGVRFSTYASWWIRAAIQNHILRNWSIVRGGTSSSQKALFFSLRRLRARLLANDDTLTTAEIHHRIAEAVGVSDADVALMDSRLSGPDLSLNASPGDSDGGAADWLEFIPDDHPLPDEAVGERIDGERRGHWLAQALRVLSERELRIIRARRLGEQPMTLEALGSTLGISKERVRQIESRALEKLRHALNEAPGAALM